MTLIFAFGSNLDEDQMLTRCPSAIVVGPASLSRVRLTFAGASQRWGGGGVAGVELAPRQRGRLHGVVYRLTDPDDLVELDLIEGHPTVYERCVAWPTLTDGRTIRADLYMLRRGLTKPRKPAQEYVAAIERGYRAFGLPLGALRAAQARAEAAGLHH